MLTDEIKPVNVFTLYLAIIFLVRDLKFTISTTYRYEILYYNHIQCIVKYS